MQNNNTAINKTVQLLFKSEFCRNSETLHGFKLL